jgi:N-ethylmaleimide reductase
VDHSSMGAPPVPADFKVELRNGFDGLCILSGGFTKDTAEAALREKRGDLVAFGRPFLANPDLLTRMQKNARLNAPDEKTFYTPGPKGYTDYPTL